MHRIAKPAIAAAVFLAAAAAIVWTVLGTGENSVAWADVQKQLLAIRTMTVTATLSQPDKPSMEMKLMFKEPGLMRQELTAPARAVNIMDMSQEQMLCLMPSDKKAIVIDLAGLPAEVKQKHMDGDFLGRMKEMAREAEVSLGEKLIDGRSTVGFEVSQGSCKFEVWADAASGEPVEMNMDFFLGEVKMTMHDFAFNVQLDDSLFSMAVPEDYEMMEQTIDVRPATAEDMVWLFKTWTRIRGGSFPDAVTPGNFVADAQGPQDADVPALSEEESLKLGQSFARVVVLVRSHPEAVYAGKGVALGDAEAPVFWYKPDRSETWTVIYGDLAVVEGVAEGDQPEAPAAADE